MAHTRPSSTVLLRFSFAAYGLAFVAMIVAVNAGYGHGIWSFAEGIPWGDKLGHLGLVGILSLLLNGVLGCRDAPGKLRFMLLGSFILLVAMSLEEASQSLNPNRTCDPFDWLANVVGIIGGELLLRRPGSARKGIRPEPIKSDNRLE